MLAFYEEQGLDPPPSPSTVGTEFDWDEWQNTPNITASDVYVTGDQDEFHQYLCATRDSTLVRGLCVPDNLIREIALFSLGRIVECCAVECFKLSVLLHRDMQTHGENGLCDRCGTWRCGWHATQGECGQAVIMSVPTQAHFWDFRKG